MSGLVVHTAQTDYVNSLAEIKAHLKVDGSDDDTALGYIRIAVDSWAQQYTGRTMTTQTYNLFIDSVSDMDSNISEGFYTGYDNNFPRRNLVLPKSPASSITHVKYYAEDDSVSTWASSNYQLDSASQPSRFTLRKGKSYPTGLRITNGLEIRYVAGYGASANVPQQIKSACLAYASFLNEHRGDIMDGKNLSPPRVATQLITPYVLKTLSTNAYKGMASRTYGGY